MDEHQVQLSPEDAARLRAFLRSPNGSFRAGRVTIEAVEGGGVLIRTRPYERRDADFGYGSAAHREIRRILVEAGPGGVIASDAGRSCAQGITGIMPSGSTVQLWLAADLQHGLVYLNSRSRWCASDELRQNPDLYLYGAVVS